jgi:hypothetical protein
MLKEFLEAAGGWSWQTLDYVFEVAVRIVSDELYVNVRNPGVAAKLLR